MKTIAASSNKCRLYLCQIRFMTLGLTGKGGTNED